MLSLQKYGPKLRKKSISWTVFESSLTWGPHSMRGLMRYPLQAQSPSFLPWPFIKVH